MQHTEMDSQDNKSDIETLYHFWMTQLSEQLPDGVPPELQDIAKKAVVAYLEGEAAKHRAMYNAATNASRGFQQRIAK